MTTVPFSFITTVSLLWVLTNWAINYRGIDLTNVEEVKMLNIPLDRETNFFSSKRKTHSVTDIMLFINDNNTPISANSSAGIAHIVAKNRNILLATSTSQALKYDIPPFTYYICNPAKLKWLIQSLPLTAAPRFVIVTPLPFLVVIIIVIIIIIIIIIVVFIPVWWHLGSLRSGAPF